VRCGRFKLETREYKRWLSSNKKIPLKVEGTRFRDDFGRQYVELLCYDCNENEAAVDWFKCM